MELGEIYILCVRVIYMLVIPACVCVLHYKTLALQGTLAENNICCNIFVHLLHHLIIRAMHSILAWQICIPRAGNCFRVILWLALFVDCFHSGLVRVLACPKTKIKIPKLWGFFSPII